MRLKFMNWMRNRIKVIKFGSNLKRVSRLRTKRFMPFYLIKLKPELNRVLFVKLFLDEAHAWFLLFWLLSTTESNQTYFQTKARCCCCCFVEAKMCNSAAWLVSLSLSAWMNWLKWWLARKEADSDLRFPQMKSRTFSCLCFKRQRIKFTGSSLIEIM